MIPAPGQGFRTGLDIQFIAIPFPLPKKMAAELVKAGERAIAMRQSVERYKDEPTKRHQAEDRYNVATADIALLEQSIRGEIGVIYTRPGFLPNQE